MFSLIPAWVRYGVPLIAGLAIGWQVQSWRHDSVLAGMRDDAIEAVEKAHTAREVELREKEQRRAALASELKEKLDEIAASDVRIASGVERVYVRASCPKLPEATPNASGSGSGAAELDPAYRPIVSQLRRRAEEQLNLLNVCRAELRLRSSN